MTGAVTMRIRRFVMADTDAVFSLWSEAFPQDPERNEPHAMISRKMARDPELLWVADPAISMGRLLEEV